MRAAHGPADIDRGVVSGQPRWTSATSASRPRSAVNALAPFWVTRAFLPAMLAQGAGHIVIVARRRASSARRVSPTTPPASTPPWVRGSAAWSWAGAPDLRVTWSAPRTASRRAFRRRHHALLAAPAILKETTWRPPCCRPSSGTGPLCCRPSWCAPAGHAPAAHAGLRPRRRPAGRDLTDEPLHPGARRGQRAGRARLTEAPKAPGRRRARRLPAPCPAPPQPRLTPSSAPRP